KCVDRTYCSQSANSGVNGVSPDKGDVCSPPPNDPNGCTADKPTCSGTPATGCECTGTGTTNILPECTKDSECTHTNIEGIKDKVCDTFLTSDTYHECIFRTSCNQNANDGLSGVGPNRGDNCTSPSIGCFEPKPTCFGNPAIGCECVAKSKCGDGTVQKPNDADFIEVCDGSDTPCGRDEYCASDCTCKVNPFCGNGVVEGNEECDKKVVNSKIDRGLGGYLFDVSKCTTGRLIGFNYFDCNTDGSVCKCLRRDPYLTECDVHTTQGVHECDKDYLCAKGKTCSGLSDNMVKSCKCVDQTCVERFKAKELGVTCGVDSDCAGGTTCNQASCTCEKKSVSTAKCGDMTLNTGEECEFTDDKKTTEKLFTGFVRTAIGQKDIPSNLLSSLLNCSMIYPDRPKCDYTCKCMGIVCLNTFNCVDLLSKGFLANTLVEKNKILNEARLPKKIFEITNEKSAIQIISKNLKGNNIVIGVSAPALTAVDYAGAVYGLGECVSGAKDNILTEKPIDDCIIGRVPYCLNQDNDKCKYRSGECNLDSNGIARVSGCPNECNSNSDDISKTNNGGQIIGSFRKECENYMCPAVRYTEKMNAVTLMYFTLGQYNNKYSEIDRNKLTEQESKEKATLAGINPKSDKERERFDELNAKSDRVIKINDQLAKDQYPSQENVQLFPQEFSLAIANSLDNNPPYPPISENFDDYSFVTLRQVGQIGQEVVYHGLSPRGFEINLRFEVLEPVKIKKEDYSTTLEINKDGTKYFYAFPCHMMTYKTNEYALSEDGKHKLYFWFLPQSCNNYCGSQDALKYENKDISDEDPKLKVAKNAVDAAQASVHAAANAAANAVAAAVGGNAAANAAVNAAAVNAVAADANLEAKKKQFDTQKAEILEGMNNGVTWDTLNKGFCVSIDDNSKSIPTGEINSIKSNIGSIENKKPTTFEYANKIGKSPDNLQPVIYCATTKDKLLSDAEKKRIIEAKAASDGLKTQEAYRNYLLSQYEVYESYEGLDDSDKSLIKGRIQAESDALGMNKEFNAYNAATAVSNKLEGEINGISEQLKPLIESKKKVSPTGSGTSEIEKSRTEKRGAFDKAVADLNNFKTENKVDSFLSYYDDKANIANSDVKTYQDLKTKVDITNAEFNKFEEQNPPSPSGDTQSGDSPISPDNQDDSINDLKRELESKSSQKAVNDKVISDLSKRMGSTLQKKLDLQKKIQNVNVNDKKYHCVCTNTGTSIPTPPKPKPSDSSLNRLAPNVKIYASAVVLGDTGILATSTDENGHADIIELDLRNYVPPADDKSAASTKNGFDPTSPVMPVGPINSAGIPGSPLA
ncbi:MAG: hypothetical protein WCP89_02680, partial [archaeon]